MEKPTPDGAESLQMARWNSRWKNASKKWHKSLEKSRHHLEIATIVKNVTQIDLFKWHKLPTNVIY